MPFPANADEMRTEGYKFLDHGVCDGCQQKIEWWLTPKGRNIPMNAMPDAKTPAIAHWANCPASGDFRNGKKH